VPLITIAILLVTVFVVDEVTEVGKVIVVLPATAGADIVTLPEVSPLITIELIELSTVSQQEQ